MNTDVNMSIIMSMHSHTYHINIDLGMGIGTSRHMNNHMGLCEHQYENLYVY